jgi:hypothetical protein
VFQGWKEPLSNNACGPLFRPTCLPKVTIYFFLGTFAPAFRAFERPIAMACLRLFTFLPLRPLFSFPRFISCISVLTCSLAEGPYLRVDFLVDFFVEDFFAVFFELFFAAFFVAIIRLLGSVHSPGRNLCFSLL